MCPQSGKDPFMRHRSSTFGMETGNDNIHDPWWTLFWHVWNWKYVKSLKPEQYRQKTIRLLFNQKWWVASKEQHQLLCEHKPKHFQVLQGWEWHRHTCPRHDIVPGRSYATLDLTLASLWTLSQEKHLQETVDSPLQKRLPTVFFQPRPLGHKLLVADAKLPVEANLTPRQEGHPT